MKTLSAGEMVQIIQVVSAAISTIDATPWDAPNRVPLATASGRLEFVRGLLLGVSVSDVAVETVECA